MEWIRTSATYTSAELKSVRACEPPQWVTPSGTSWISSPGCRRWVDGETVEVLHVHCSFLAHAAMSWTRSLDWRFISSITLQWTWLYFNGYFIHFVTLHLTYRNLELISSDTREFSFFDCWKCGRWFSCDDFLCRRDELTHSGTCVNISPGCRRCVDGETVLHLHCFLSRMHA